MRSVSVWSWARSPQGAQGNYRSEHGTRGSQSPDGKPFPSASSLAAPSPLEDPKGFGSHEVPPMLGAGPPAPPCPLPAAPPALGLAPDSRMTHGKGKSIATGGVHANPTARWPSALFFFCATPNEDAVCRAGRLSSSGWVSIEGSPDLYLLRE